MLRQHKYLLGLAVVVAVLVGVLIASFQRFASLQDQITVETRSALWNVSQLEKELLRFLSTAALYRVGDPGTSREDLLLRFEILWSRVPVLIDEGPDVKIWVHLSGAQELISRLGETLEELEPLVQQMQPGDHQALIDLSEALQPHADEIHQLATAAYYDPSWFVTFWNDRTKFARLETALAIIAVVVSVILFIVLLVRSMQRAERLLADAQKAEQARSLSEQRFKDFASAGSDWFWETDSELKLTYVSDGHYRHYGLPKEEVIGKKITDILAKSVSAYPEVWQRYFDAVENHRDFRDFDHEVIGLRDERTVTRCSARAIFDEQGGFVGYRGISRDITKEIKDRESAEEAREQLRQAQKLHAIGQLTGGIAHDFNNLLAVVSGNAEVMALRYGKDDELVTGILNAADRGADLTQRLRAFSRQQPLNPVAIDVMELGDSMAALFERTLGERLEFHTRIPPDLPPIYADRGQLENALLNLAINARDAMPDGGRIDLVAASASVWADRFPSHFKGDPGEFIVLSLSDNGTGMDPQVRERAIEPFYTTKDVNKGTGLGLSMVYGFTTQSGGFLDIDSQAGGGTTVSMILPRANDAPQRSEAGKVLQINRAETKRQLKILVVEDDPDVRKLTAKLLELLGYKVIIASNGEAALEILGQEHDVSLILTDMVLTGDLSGLDLAQAAKSRFSVSRFIFMSGYPDEVLREANADIGKITLLAKPFRLKQLSKKVEEAFSV